MNQTQRPTSLVDMLNRLPLQSVIDVESKNRTVYTSAWSEKYTHFFNAIANNDWNTYETRVKSMDLMQKTLHDETILHIAIFHDNLPVVQDLMNRLPDKQKQQLFQSSAFGGYTPLTLAAHKRNTNMVQVLLQNGAEPLQKGKNEQDAYDIAIKNNKLHIVLLLEEYEPDLKSRSKILPSYARGKTAAHLLRDEEKSKLRLALLEAIANKDFDTFRTVIAQGADVNTHADTQHGTPLIRAIQSDCPTEFIVELLKANANINLANSNKQTPLMVALACNRNDIAKKLLQQEDVHVCLQDAQGEYILNYTNDIDLRLAILDKTTKQNPTYKTSILLGIVNILLEDILKENYNDTLLTAKKNVPNLLGVPTPAYGVLDEITLLQQCVTEGKKIPSSDASIKYVLTGINTSLSRIRTYYEQNSR